MGSSLLKIKGLALLFPFLLVSNTFAQTVILPNAPYFNGFETPAERAGWTLINNANPNVNPNAWVFGNAIYADGLNSGDNTALYISRDGGATAGHTAHPGFVTAYKDFVLGANRRGICGFYILWSKQLPFLVVRNCRATSRKCALTKTVKR